ncbi:MAG TPA: threonine--tRNA ligase [Dissulfurispiraceae bacterium]|nr:threonine--tRNA ligase [Dissulfurispiraceae bacterium]
MHGGIAIKLILPDGTVTNREPAELKKDIESSRAVALKINGDLTDLSAAETAAPDAAVELITFASPEGKDLYRHSTAHIMAHAVKLLFPDTKVAIGPAIDEGFYYDFDRAEPFTPEDLSKIETKMKEIIRKNSPFVRKVVSRAEAIALFEQTGDEYKVELIDAIPDETVSLYDEDGFVDLCRGPHVHRTGRVKAFKLLSVAGAYWRGDAKNKMLQRIYGTAFETKDELKAYLDFLEEVKKRDHRRIGRELDLFSTDEEIGSGLILWHPNGSVMRRTIEDFWRDEHVKADYQILYTPHIAQLKLWERSGHWQFYRENMYEPMEIDDVAYELKPMNCPFHISIYNSSLRSYRELPIRYAELGTVYRYEKSGVLHGLLRVRGFTQDDAHIFCREDQIENEIRKILKFTLFVLNTFGFESYDIYLSTQPEKFVGTPEIWERSTEALKRALEASSLPYRTDEGGGAFYGPKIDIKIKDALNRSWQCSTIQLDFNNPDRFDMNYRGSDGKDHRPIMIHRALMGSLERFIGILVEHYAGNFPVWLTPTQVAVLTIAERHELFAQEVYHQLRAQGFRVQLDADNEKIGFKIRRATMKKIPYLVLLGDREVDERKITVRKRDGENIGPYSIKEFTGFLSEAVRNKQ